MGCFDWLFGYPPQPMTTENSRHVPDHTAHGIVEAQRIMRGLNPNALCGREDGEIVFIEDHADPDGRLYRLEYRSNPSGSQATAWCRYKPWPDKSYSVHQCHLFGNGQICLGNSPYTLNDAVKRTRYWAAAYSYLREHGTWPD